MPDLDTLLERNRRFSESYEGGLPTFPRLSTFVLTCVDSRVDPASFLGLELGDALVFRNPGARVTDAVELELGIMVALVSRGLGDAFAGLSLALIQHTGCGFERVDDPEVAADLSQRLGLAPSYFEGLANRDHARCLREDIERLRRSSLVPNRLVVSGHLYCVETGTLKEIVPPAPLA
jgi:carbonic anhydrase